MQKKILIIEDSILSRTFIKNFLLEKNVQIAEAVNGLDGIKKIRENTPDLIFLDLLMPELDGFEVLERLKKAESKIPVIILTADIQETSKKRCFDLGAKFFLNKPFKKEKFIDVLKSVFPEESW
jgi:twitching motility two-component system response regulator PilH